MEFKRIVELGEEIVELQEKIFNNFWPVKICKEAFWIVIATYF